jgi:hypothetical protein
MRSKALAVQSLLEMIENRAKDCQLSGHSAASRARCRALCVPSLVLLIVITGCGTSGFNPNNVTVTISPATATAPENGQVPLQATVNGLCSGCVPSIQEWSITENEGSGCTWMNTPPAGPCPGGTIQEAATGTSLTVTYFAPSAPGTFHVIADVCLCFEVNPPVSKEGTSVITVSP